MPRHPRNDTADSWHHVMNRGIARRTLFETQADIRVFLSRLAREVRAGRVEVHAFCVLTTHFHLLVRSPIGKLSTAMQRVQNEYARWFNRSRHRDGPLHRSRFRSKRIDTLAYRELLVRYIDANAVASGLVPSAELYPHGSARSYALDRGPPWLSRGWVEATVRRHSGSTSYDPRRYSSTFGPRGSPTAHALVERRIGRSRQAEDPLDALLHAAPAVVLDWMRRKARLADGTAIGVPVCDERTVGLVVERARECAGAWAVRPNGRAVDAWPIVHVGLLRELCGSTLREAGARSGRAAKRAFSLDERHRRLMHDDETYASRASELAREALIRCHDHAP